MNCPKCIVPLSMTDRQGVEIDFCPQCRGVWLDRGELDKIIERAGAITGALPVPPAGSGPPPQPPLPPQHRDYRDYRDYRRDDDDDDDYRHRSSSGGYDSHGRKKKKGFFGDLFDF